MNKTHAFILVSALVLGSCQESELYTRENIENVDTKVELFRDGLTIPILKDAVGFRADSLIGKLNDDVDTTGFSQYLKTDAEGNYYLEYSGSENFADEISLEESFTDFTKFENITFDNKFHYDLNQFGTSAEIDIPSFFHKETFKGGIAGVTGQDYSFNVNLDPINCNKTILKRSDVSAAAVFFGDNEFSIPDNLIPELQVDESMDFPAFEIPSGIKEIKEIKLDPNASINISVSLDNMFLTAGEITPEIVLDLSEILKLKDNTSGKVSLNSLKLSSENNFKMDTAIFLTGVNPLTLTQEKKVTVKGDIKINGAKTMKSRILNGTENTSLNISLNYRYLKVDDIIAEIEPVAIEPDEIVFKTDFNDIVLPDGISSINSITLDTQSPVRISLKADNIPSGLNISLDRFDVRFPALFTIPEASAGNVVSITGDIAQGISKDIAISKITLPAPVGKTISINEAVFINAHATASGIISTKELASSQDVLCTASFEGDPEILDVDITADSDKLVQMINHNYAFSFIDAEKIPEELVGIDSIVFGKNTTLQLQMSLEGFPAALNNKMHLHAECIFPEYVDFKGDNTIVFDKDITDDMLLNVGPLEIKGINMEGIKIHDGIDANCAITGDLSITDPNIKLSDLQDLGVVGILFNGRLGGQKDSIEIKKVACRLDLDIDGETHIPFLGKLDDLEELKDYSLNLPDIIYAVDINSNFGIPFKGKAGIVPFTDSGDETEKKVEVELEMPYSPTAAKYEKKHISDTLKLYDLLQSRADSAKICYTAKIDGTCIIEPDAEYGLDVDYLVKMPLTFGEGFGFNFRFEEEIPENLKDILMDNSFGITANITNGLPFGVGVGIRVLDQNHDPVSTKQTGTSEIKPCKADGSPRTSDFTAQFSASALADNQVAAYLEVTLSVLTTSRVPLGESSEIVVNSLAILLPEGISVDPTTLK